MSVLDGLTCGCGWPCGWGWPGACVAESVSSVRVRTSFPNVNDPQPEVQSTFRVASEQSPVSSLRGGKTGRADAARSRTQWMALAVRVHQDPGRQRGGGGKESIRPEMRGRAHCGEGFYLS